MNILFPSDEYPNYKIDPLKILLSPTCLNNLMSFILTSVSLEYSKKLPLGCKPMHFI